MDAVDQNLQGYGSEGIIDYYCQFNPFAYSIQRAVWILEQGGVCLFS